MSQLIVAVLGISGVGKTTFLHSVAETLCFQHLTAGTLISSARSEAGSRDNLRLNDIRENQALLVAGFATAKDATAPLIILDGHAVIHGALGLVSVPAGVFADMGVGAIAHFEADPQRISTNRAGDSLRSRPSLTVDELAFQQLKSLEAAQQVATSLKLPFRRFTGSDASAFCAFAEDASRLGFRA